MLPTSSMIIYIVRYNGISEEGESLSVFSSLAKAQEFVHKLWLAYGIAAEDIQITKRVVDRGYYC